MLARCPTTGDPRPILAPAGPPWTQGRQASARSGGGRRLQGAWGAAGAHARVHVCTRDSSQTASPQEQEPRVVSCGASAPPHPRRLVCVYGVELSREVGSCPLPGPHGHPTEGVQWGFAMVRGGAVEEEPSTQGLRSCSKGSRPCPHPGVPSAAWWPPG